MIDVQRLPKDIQDIIELKEQTDQTFHRFTDNDYTEWFWNLLRERADPGVEHSVILSISGLQGCHLKGTMIQTKRGLKPIEIVVAGDEVWSGGEWRPCVPIIKGVQQTMRVTLRNGMVLNMTPDHVMKTTAGWKSVQEMQDEMVREKKPGEWVAVREEGIVLCPGDVQWSSEWNDDSERAMVIGMLLADGHLDELKTRQKYDYVRKTTTELRKEPKKEHVWVKKRARFYSKDEELHELFCSALVKHYGATATGSYDDVFKGVMRSKVTCIQNADVVNKLHFAGVPYGKKSSIVEIPSWVQVSDAAMNGFLAGYFVCDGGLSGGSVEITSCSEKLVRQMQNWLCARGVITSVSVRPGAKDHHQLKWRLACRQRESLEVWIDHVPVLLGRKKVVLRAEDTKAWVKYDDVRIEKWWGMKGSGMSYQKIADAEGVCFAPLWQAMNAPETRGTRSEKSNSTKEHLLTIESIEVGEVGEVYDLHVKDVHEYLANGVVSKNSGKSLSAISICSFLDPNFLSKSIYFGYNDLVYARRTLKPNTAVLVDEQSQAYGLDSHRINVILAGLKEQLRKKSIHFVFCAPVLYPEHESSMWKSVV